MASESDDPVVAPGYQCALFPAPRARRARWRAVSIDAARLPQVGQLGVAIAQARALVLADGVAWIVGSDEHTVEISRRVAGFDVVGVTDGAPRWAFTVRTALARSRI
jgi:hypothetical protein